MSGASIARAAARSATGIVVGAGASLLGVIAVTVYSMALGGAVFQELGLLPSRQRPR